MHTFHKSLLLHEMHLIGVVPAFTITLMPFSSSATFGKLHGFVTHSVPQPPPPLPRLSLSRNPTSRTLHNFANELNQKLCHRLFSVSIIFGSFNYVLCRHLKTANTRDSFTRLNRRRIVRNTAHSSTNSNKKHRVCVHCLQLLFIFREINSQSFVSMCGAPAILLPNSIPFDMTLRLLQNY